MSPELAAILGAVLGGIGLKTAERVYDLLDKKEKRKENQLEGRADIAIARINDESTDKGWLRAELGRVNNKLEAADARANKCERQYEILKLRFELLINHLKENRIITVAYDVEDITGPATGDPANEDAGHTD